MRWLAGCLFVTIAMCASLCATAAADEYPIGRLPREASSPPTPDREHYPSTGVGVGSDSQPRSNGHAAVGYETSSAGTPHNQNPGASLSGKPSNSLMLPPRTSTQTSANRTKTQTPTRAVTTVVTSLAVVLGVFFLVVWFARRFLPQTAASLPNEVVELLGRTSLGARQQFQVLRFGNKLLLVSVTSTGSETLSEITDPDEVDRIAAICQQSKPGSISESFRHVLSGLTGQSQREDTGAAAQSQNASPSESSPSRQRRAA